MMWHEPLSTSMPAANRRAGLLAMIIALTFSAPTAGHAEPHDPSLSRRSDAGLFQVDIQSDVTPIPLRRIHGWTLRLSDPAGRPVSDAAVLVGGGMPDHGHGLPTQPRVTPTTEPGRYEIDGVRFSMTGWWVLHLTIRTADGGSDRVTFNITL